MNYSSDYDYLFEEYIQSIYDGIYKDFGQMVDMDNNVDVDVLLTNQSNSNETATFFQNSNMNIDESIHKSPSMSTPKRKFQSGVRLVTPNSNRRGNIHNIHDSIMKVHTPGKIYIFIYVLMKFVYIYIYI